VRRRCRDFRISQPFTSGIAQAFGLAKS
jgi:hypothetical protein